MKLQPRHVQPVVMAGIMAFLMTAFLTWLNQGFPPDFVWRWAKAYALAWPLASLAAYVAAPIAPRITQRILRAVNGAA
jgi:hypothetical protein